MQVDFDPDKDSANLAKHGVPLAFGAEELGDPDRLDVLDVRFDYPEERFVCYGRVGDHIWVCVFTVRGDHHRIISVRKANDREIRRYHDSVR